MSITEWLSRSPGEPRDHLTPEQKATIDIDALLSRARVAYQESLQAAAAFSARSRRLTESAQRLLLANGGPISSTAVVLGLFAVLIWLGTYALDFTLFKSLGLGTASTALLSVICVCVFAAGSKTLLVGEGPMPRLSGETNGRKLQAAMILVVLLAGAFLIARQLGPARAHESYDSKIASARATVQNDIVTAATKTELDAAKATLADEVAGEARLEKMCTLVLIVAYLAEIGISGYSVDFLRASLAGYRKRQAARCADAAEDETDAAAAGDVNLAAQMAAIARKHGLPMDALDDLVRARLAAIQAFGVGAPDPSGAAERFEEVIFIPRTVVEEPQAQPGVEPSPADATVSGGDADSGVAPASPTTTAPDRNHWDGRLV